MRKFSFILLALGLGIPEMAWAQSTADMIYACVGQGSALARIVGAAEACRGSETRVMWNVVGPQGPKGDPGPQGPQGDTGPAGPTPDLTPLLARISALEGLVNQLSGPTGANADAAVTGKWSGKFITMQPFLHRPFFHMSGNSSSGVNGDFNIITLPIFDPAHPPTSFFNELIQFNLDVPNGETLAMAEINQPITLTFARNGQLLQGTGVGGSDNAGIVFDGVVIGGGFVLLRGEFQASGSCAPGRFTVFGALRTNGNPSALSLTGSGRDGNCDPFFFRAGLQKE